jgi:hypothetical protein
MKRVRCRPPCSLSDEQRDQRDAHFAGADAAMYAEHRKMPLARQPVLDRPVVLHHQRVVADSGCQARMVGRRAEPAGGDQPVAGVEVRRAGEMAADIGFESWPILRAT